MSKRLLFGLSSVAQITSGAVLVASAWMLAGYGGYVREICWFLSGLGMVAAVAACVCARDYRRLLNLLPCLLYGTWLILALLNPSHLGSEAEGWTPNPSYRPWLPGAVDRWYAGQWSWYWLVGLAQFGILRMVIQSGAEARRFALGIVCHVLLLTVVGLWFWSIGTEKLLGHWALEGQIFSSFIYKNHWAAYALMGAGLSAGLALAVPETEPDPRRAGSRRLFLGSAFALILASIPLPGSRSGTVLAMLLLTLAGWSYLRARGREERSPKGIVLIGASAVLLLTAALVAPAVEQGWERSVSQYFRDGDLEDKDIRVRIARDTLGMIEASPWFGWGPGGFAAAFPAFRGKGYPWDVERGDFMQIQDAHSDWLQIPAEYGVPAAAILAAAALVLLLRGSLQASRGLRFGMIGPWLVLAYAGVEFPFQNPAVLILWASLLALGQSRTTRSSGEK